MNPRSSLDGRRSNSRSSRLASLLACLVVVTLAIGLVAAPVSAHAYLSETDPGNGEQVDSVPEEVILYFSGDGVVNADITIDGPDGEAVSGEPEIDPDDTQIVRVPIDDTADDDGMYLVEWQILADDGHTTSGSFFFAVGDEPLDRDAVLEAYEPDEEDESVPLVEAGAKSLLLVGVVGVLGIPAMAAFAVGPVFGRRDASIRETIDRRISWLLAGAVALTLVSAFALGLTRATAIGPLSAETLSQFVETPLGEAWLGQLALAVALVGLVTAMTRGSIDRFTAFVGAFAGGLGISGTIAWTSHSATAIDRLQGTVIDFLHLAGAGLWIGGLAVLAFTVVPAVRDASPDDRAALLARAIRRFSILALVGVTLVVSTGFVLASWHVPTADGLTETFYGLTLAAKLVLATVALALGGLTRFVLLKRLDSSRPAESADGALAASTDGGVDRDGDSQETDGRLRTISHIARTTRLEVALLVVVLLLSGVLTSVPTAAVVTASDEELTEATIEYEYDDVLVEVTAFPAAGEAADNESFILHAEEPIVFEVAFLDGDGNPIESQQPVRLLADSDDGPQTEVELEETDDGTYATVQPLSSAGQWDLRITGSPGGTYVSEWIEATALSADSHEDHDHDDDADDHGHDDDQHDDDAPDDHVDHEHADDDQAGHDHDETDSSSAFQVLLQFGAVATVLVGAVAVSLETVRLRNRNEN